MIRIPCGSTRLPRKRSGQGTEPGNEADARGRVESFEGMRRLCPDRMNQMILTEGGPVPIVFQGRHG